MPKKIEELLDRRQMAGPLSLDQIACTVENGSCITAMTMTNDISALMRMVQENTVQLAAAAPEPVSVDVNQTTQRLLPDYTLNTNTCLMGSIDVSLHLGSFP
jgi:hypothetical protein